MSTGKKLSLAIAVLILASLACSLLPTEDPTPIPDSEDVIATAVAATMAAEGEEGAPAGDTPEITPEPPPFLRIVFVKNSDVWYWEEGGAPIQLTTLGDVFNAILSDDGAVVAFTRGPDWYHQELFAINSDGSGLRPLITSATLAGYVTHPDAISAMVYRMDWEPGTHNVAFNTRLTFEGPGLVLNDDLHLVDADTATLTTVLPAGQGGDFYYSPNGNQIALVTATEVIMANSDGTNRQVVLSFPVVITYSEYNYYPPVTWMADNSAVRAAVPPNDPMVDPPELTTIWHIPADGSPPNTLTTITPVAFSFVSVSISPDTGKFSYPTLVTPGAPPIVDLHIANIDGSGDVIYDSGDRRFEGWSTDGEHFIFTEAGHNPKIGRIGSPALNLTGITLMLDVSWVDETRFLYQNRLSGSWELWLGELGNPGILLSSTTGDSISYDFIR